MEIIEKIVILKQIIIRKSSCFLTWIRKDDRIDNNDDDNSIHTNKNKNKNKNNSKNDNNDNNDNNLIL